MTDPLEEGVPRAIAITWGMVADPQRGPKRGLSHEGIVEAAIKIADADGLSAVTMSKVAASLGVTTMALYRYVTNKDELLLLMQEGVLTPSAPDPTLSDGRTVLESRGWRAELAEFAGMLRGVYLDHPWIADVPQSVPQLLTPSNLATVDHALRAMRDLPVGDPDKIAILLAMVSYIRANATLVADLSRPADLPADPSEFLREVVTPETFPFLDPLVRSGRYMAPEESEDPLDDYRFGLELILDGIAAYAERHPIDAAPVEEPQQDQHALELDHVRKDPKVREAMAKRKDAENKLREARRKEQEMIKRALDRGPK
jgi:AcrR family transcriptional regulator